LLVEEIVLQVENSALRGRVYWPGGEKHLLEAQPMLILCHGIPRAKAGTVAESDVETETEAAPDTMINANAQRGAEKNPPIKEEEDGGYAALAAQCVARLGLPVFHFNFRGTGESEGNFDLLGWTRDLVAFLDYWEGRGANNGFYLWGFSAGAAVSSCVAAMESRVRKVILGACPASFRKIFSRESAKQLIQRFRLTGIIRQKDFPPDQAKWHEDLFAVEPVEYIGRLAPRPLLLAHGTADELIPLDHAYELYKNAGRGRNLLILPGALHQLRREEKAVELCLDWLKKAHSS